MSANCKQKCKQIVSKGISVLWKFLMHASLSYIATTSMGDTHPPWHYKKTHIQAWLIQATIIIVGGVLFCYCGSRFYLHNNYIVS